MPRKRKQKLEKIENVESIRELVNEAISTHNEEFIIHLIYKIQLEYYELARLATLDSFEVTWTHEHLIDYITKEM